MALALHVLSIVMAAPSAAQSSESAKSESRGEQLADLLDPVDMLVAMDGRLLRQLIAAAAAQYSDLAAMAQKQPKQFEAVLNAGQNVEAEILRREYPAEQIKIGAIFDQTLTEADLNTLLDYYRSPLGKKVVALGFANMNRAGNASGATRQNEMENTARLRMVSQLSPEERQQMVAFAQTSAVQHFEPVNAERRKMRAAWAQSLMPQIQRDTGAAMNAVVARYDANGDSVR